MPMEVSGKSSPRRTMKRSAIAQSQISDSFQRAAVTVRVGQTNETACRTMGNPNSAMNNPNQVTRRVVCGVLEMAVIDVDPG
jgi:hypothetical protein